VSAERFLITGAGGFAGGYMCSCLNAQPNQVEVIGTDIDEPSIDSYSRFFVADACSAEAVADILRRVVPDYIIHLAGSFGGKDDQEAYRVNLLSMTALLEAVRKHAPHAVVIAAGSAAEYGIIPENKLPANEHTFCQPITPYGLSKLFATKAAMHYHRTYGVHIMVARPFQLIGKGVTSRLVPGAFARQLKKATSEGRGVIRVGNLESFRDFLDIHDFSEAILSLCRNPAPGEVFNVCSGEAVKIFDMLEMMIAVSRAKVRIEVDPTRLRGQADVSTIFGDYRKIEKHCGWRPRLSLRQSIKAMFEDD
jgi:GDP-4-dehydro-6-deoxy-D-mannose reductase